MQGLHCIASFKIDVVQLTLRLHHLLMQHKPCIHIEQSTVSAICSTTFACCHHGQLYSQEWLSALWLIWQEFGVYLPDDDYGLLLSA